MNPVVDLLVNKKRVTKVLKEYSNKVKESHTKIIKISKQL